MLRHRLLLFSLLLLSSFNYGQSSWKYFESFNEDQKKVIGEHWEQYFNAPIHQKLNPNIILFPVRLDSYGSLYPNDAILDGFDKQDFNPKNRKNKNNLAYSLIDLFNYHKNQKNSKLEVNILKLTNSEERNFYSKLRLKNSVRCADSILDFYQRWDDYHFPLKIEELKQTIRKSEIKKVLFFVHGYNVPYSLATIQAQAVHQVLQDGGVNMSAVLMVPIYWPSNNAKKLNLKDEQHFTIANKKSLNNGLSSLYFSNRAYFAAIGLRRILKELENEAIDIYLISHSLGATVVTTALINTFSKLHTNLTDEVQQVDNAYSFFTKNEKKLLKEKEFMNYEILKRMLAVPLVSETRPMFIFMSAAAIPGVNTFCNWPYPNLGKKIFFVPINYQDEMLNKKLPIKFKPSRLGSTTLGINYFKEAEITQALFPDRDHFKIPIVSNNIDHDLLVYLQQKGYRNFLLEFIKQ